MLNAWLFQSGLACSRPCGLKPNWICEGLEQGFRGLTEFPFPFQSFPVWNGWNESSERTPPCQISGQCPSSPHAATKLHSLQSEGDTISCLEEVCGTWWVVEVDKNKMLVYVWKLLVLVEVIT